MTLNTFYEANSESGSKVRIFAVGLMTSAPSGVSEYIYVGSPESKALVYVSVVATGLHIVFGTSFGGYRITDFFQKVLIESSGKTDSLREYCGNTRSRNSVKSFVPPVVGIYVKPVDGCSGM